MPASHLLLLLLGCLGGWQLATAATRDVVRQIATLIENNYFDPDKAAAIAAELRRTHRAGAYAQLDSRDLANRLTRALKPYDQHFNVVWVAASAVREPRNAGSLQSPFGARSGYGFRAFERLSGNIGYLDLRFFAYFSERDPAAPERMAAAAALQLLDGTAALILDLRNNFGGWSPMVGYLVSAFVPADAEVYNVIHGRHGTESERPVRPHAQPRTDLPIYILVSGSTASAAESAAYTLQAARRAIVVGERTAGAANPGGEFPVGAGFNVFISIGTPINPITGSNWEGVGVTPDVPVDAALALSRAHQLAIEHLLSQPENAGSAELTWTLEALHATQSPPPRGALKEFAAEYSDVSVSFVDGDLLLRRDRRAPLRLRPLRDDTFFVADDPLRRVVFERDGQGKIRGLQLVRASGLSSWHPK